MRCSLRHSLFWSLSESSEADLGVCVKGLLMQTQKSWKIQGRIDRSHSGHRNQNSWSVFYQIGGSSKPYEWTFWISWVKWSDSTIKALSLPYHIATYQTKARVLRPLRSLTAVRGSQIESWHLQFASTRDPKFKRKTWSSAWAKGREFATFSTPLSCRFLV